MPFCAALPEWKRFAIAPYCEAIRPAACEPARPSALTNWSTSSLSSLPIVAAAAKAVEDALLGRADDLGRQILIAKRDRKFRDGPCRRGNRNRYVHPAFLPDSAEQDEAAQALMPRTHGPAAKVSCSG